jgi:hypothetical protein
MEALFKKSHVGSRKKANQKYFRCDGTIGAALAMKASQKKIPVKNSPIT